VSGSIKRSGFYPRLGSAVYATAALTRRQYAIVVVLAARSEFVIYLLVYHPPRSSPSGEARDYRMRK
jgi:hypothetical protein